MRSTPDPLRAKSSSSALGVLFLAAFAACDDVTAPGATGQPALRMNTAPVENPQVRSDAGPVALVNAASTHCGAVSGDGRQRGNFVVLAACRPDAPEQRFVATAAGELRTAAGMCLDATHATGRDGDRVIIWPCHGGANQRWTRTPGEELRGIAGKCVDLLNRRTAVGTPLVLGTCNAALQQRWRAEVASPVRAVRLNTGAVALAAGATVQLAATPVDGSGQIVATRQAVTWTSAQPTVATVSPTGQVTAVAAGSATITATVDGRSATAAVTVTGRAVVVRVGESLQAKVDSYPERTTFLIKAGVHRRQQVYAKSGDTFVGEPGAVLTGEGVTAHAFTNGNGRWPSDVTLRRLTIERYAPPEKLGAVFAGGIVGYRSGGWVVEDCEIRYNGGSGIRIGPRMIVRRNKLHHNARTGVVGIGDDVLIEQNEIAYNNYEAKYDYFWEAGGAKFVQSNRLTVRNNFVHHNTGPGLWTDIDVRDVLYEGNRVEDNASSGIMHEISHAATIRNNVLRRNGGGRQIGVSGAGIFIHTSAGVDVYGNTVEDNAQGITLVQKDRGSGPFGRYAARNVHVHDNKIRTSTGVTGFEQEVGDPSLFATANVRFVRNTYDLRAAASRPFTWRGGRRTEAEWQAHGLDAGGQFVR